MLCGPCILQGFCRRLRSRIATAEELASRRFVRDLKAHARKLDISFDRWADYLIDAYRDYPGRIVEQTGKEVALDTSVLGSPLVKYWFRDFIGKDPAPVTIGHIRVEAKPRVVAMATILRAIHPVPAMLWGREIANDVTELPLPANDVEPGCPWPRLHLKNRTGGR